jgi:GMP synthase (glutamine-hydrolysing)
MGKRILVVQSRSDPERIEGERANFRHCMGRLADVEFLSALDERLAWSTPDEFLGGFDGVIFGGSSDFDFHGGRDERDPARVTSFIILSRSRNLVSYALAEKIPLLGICYGHQLIANIYGGEVDHDKEQSKFGSFEVRLTEEGKRDPVLGSLPETFVAQYAHNDSVTKLPEGATLLASTSGCRFSALRYGTSAYTLQFHPELTRFDDLDLDYRDSSESSKIIPLWIERNVGELRLTGKNKGIYSSDHRS